MATLKFIVDIRVILLAVAFLLVATRAQWGWKAKLDLASKDLNEDVNEAVRLHEESDFVSSLPFYLRALRRCDALDPPPDSFRLPHLLNTCQMSALASWNRRHCRHALLGPRTQRFDVTAGTGTPPPALSITTSAQA